MHKMRRRFRQSLKGELSVFCCSRVPAIVCFLFFFLFFFFERIIVHSWKTIAVWYIQWFWLVESNMGLKNTGGFGSTFHVSLFFPLLTEYSIWSRAFALSTCGLQSQTTVPRLYCFESSTETPRSLPRPGSDACHRTIWIMQKRRS